MRSGEWLKGKIVALYDAELEVDSDEFDRMILKWRNIRQIRTSQDVSVGLLGLRSVVGKLVLFENEVTVYGERVEKFDKAEVLTIAAGTLKERNYWTSKVFVGVIVRSGNTEIREFNVQGDFQRRTIRNRFVSDIVLNQNTTEGVEVSNNQRLGAKWDKFIDDRLFITVLGGEYFRDPFQNISARYTVGALLGYQLRDSPTTEWTISAGPGYQETRFESVAAGEDDSESTPALIFSTRADWDITNWLTSEGVYRFQRVNEASGTYTHHILLSFETSVTRRIDFDISWIWDRIEDPTPTASGETPKSDDFRTTVGLSFDF